MIPSQVRIFVCTERQDMRRSFDALDLDSPRAALVRARSAPEGEHAARFDEVERAIERSTA